MSLTDGDLFALLRALPGELPRRRFSPALRDVRAGARRRRARARALGAAALVLLVAAGVGIPVGLSGRDGRMGASVVPARQPVQTYGGFSVGWLPDGLTHTLDTATYDRTESSWGYGPVDGSGRALRSVLLQTLPDDLARMAVVPAVPDDTTFGSLFTAADGDSGPSSAWVTVTWRPSYVNVHAMVAQVEGRGPGDGVVDVAADTVAGRPALVLRRDVATVGEESSAPGAWGPPVPPPPDERYETALLWTDSTGVLYTVALNGPRYSEPAVLHRIADGVVRGTMPTAGGYLKPRPAPVPVDAATAADVRAAIEAAFTAGTPDGQWAAAVQDGAELLPVRADAARRFPARAGAVTTTVDTMTRVDRDTVDAWAVLEYHDPTLPPPEPAGGWVIRPTVVRTADGWKVARDDYCALMVPLHRRVEFPGC